MNGISTPYSKLPNESISIFTKMSQMARRYNAVDLSQGYPNFETDDYLKDLVGEAIAKGFNQYAPMPGVLSLRIQIAEKIAELYDICYNFDTEITITAGASQAIYCGI